MALFAEGGGSTTTIFSVGWHDRTSLDCFLLRPPSSQVPDSGVGGGGLDGSSLGTSNAAGWPEGERLHCFPHPPLPPHEHILLLVVEVTILTLLM